VGGVQNSVVGDSGAYFECVDKSVLFGVYNVYLVAGIPVKVGVDESCAKSVVSKAVNGLVVVVGDDCADFGLTVSGAFGDYLCNLKKGFVPGFVYKVGIHFDFTHKSRMVGVQSDHQQRIVISSEVNGNPSGWSGLPGVVEYQLNLFRSSQLLQKVNCKMTSAEAIEYGFTLMKVIGGGAFDEAHVINMSTGKRMKLTLHDRSSEFRRGLDGEQICNGCLGLRETYVGLKSMKHCNHYVHILCAYMYECRGVEERCNLCNEKEQLKEIVFVEYL
jgi:hypothetical protein